MMQFPEYNSFNFPCGEKHVRVTRANAYKNDKGEWLTDIKFDFKSNEDIIELLLLVNALKHMDCRVGRLYIPYLPFSRQDRVCSNGDAFSLEVMIDLINGINAERVIIIDPHSDVSLGINNLKVIEQHTVFQPYFENRDRNTYVLVSPDKGAINKTKKLALANDQANLIHCSKVRDPKTGKLSGFKIEDWYEDYAGLDLIVLDDIADGCGTFVGIAQELKKFSPDSKIILMVTHGFFTKTLSVLDGYIDEIYTRNGRVK